MNPAARDPRLPSATYRVQLTRDFTFRHLLELVGYFDALGITDLYASPFLTARPGSTHGYDVVDPGTINREIGTDEDLARLHDALAARQMGFLIDIVPNHVCVNTNDNPWWNDVLENGPASPYARTFDIDWRPPKNELRDKVLLPVLGEQYGKVLEGGELELSIHEGALVVVYADRRFPLAPFTWGPVLEGVAARLRGRSLVAGDPSRARVEALAGAVRALGHPADTGGEAGLDTQNDKRRIKVELGELLTGSPAVREALAAELGEWNGRPGDPHSFDRLERLLAQQAYRLSYWRVAAEQINYRRFFDINDLAAVRVEDPEVLDAVHAKAFELYRRGWVTGLRVDHLDGLRDPRAYLDQLAARAPRAYVVVEKILGVDERLPRAWATEGTTGYELLNVLNGLWLWRSGEKALRAVYEGVRTATDSFAEVVYQSKSLILRSSMAGELSVLARRLARISEQHRWSRDFTLGSLELALADVVACFPAYRTYLGPAEEITPQAAKQVQTAVAAARRRNPALSGSVFEFLSDVLLARDPDGLDDRQRALRRDFVARFQQLTGPVMAKGLEDTAFYRYFPLLSLNEVGGSPERFGVTVEEFHRLMEERARERPAALSATATHDTKRGEDSRARLDVLSEIPDEWSAAVAEWREIALRLKPRADGLPTPDAEDEYFIFQTLLGAWPTRGIDDPMFASFAERVQGAVEKALREAKRQTSWIDPNATYEGAARDLCARLCDPSGPFVPKLAAFAARIRRPGQLNALAQLVVKSTAPGVPDFYQGSELWDLSLVDPDNRRPVDYPSRRRLLEELDQQAAADPAELASALLAAADDGRIKLWMTAALLRARRRERELFARGAYLPLVAEGGLRDNVVGFARRWSGRVAVIAVGRFFTQLPPEPTGGGWGDASLSVPPELSMGELTSALTGRSARVVEGRLRLAELFDTLPFAVLIGDVEPGLERPA